MGVREGYRVTGIAVGDGDKSSIDGCDVGDCDNSSIEDCDVGAEDKSFNDGLDVGLALDLPDESWRLHGSTSCQAALHSSLPPSLASSSSCPGEKSNWVQ